jgi:hypothetical protein
MGQGETIPGAAEPTPESLYLRQRARPIAAVYIAHATPAAMLLTGSAALGVADRYSDLDLIAYHDELPSDEDLEGVREMLGATGFVPIGARAPDGFAEQFVVDGVVCQVGHATVPAWEAEMRTVLEDLDVTSLTHKAMDGLLQAMPLHGEPLIRRWLERASAYPDTLARAMITHHLQLFPIWYLEPSLPARDATVWVAQMLVEGAQHLLGMLAGLNRRYYTPFQFKHMRTFAAGLQHAPEDLATRIDALFAMGQGEASVALETLVAETVALVEAAMPEIDTGPVRQRIGKRHTPWSMPE